MTPSDERMRELSKPMTDAQREALEAEGWGPTYYEGKTSGVLAWECQAEGFTQQIGEKTAARLADSYIAEAKDVCVCCMGSGLDNTGSGSCLICDGTGKGDYARRH